jgi:hypothetical protein
MKPRKERERKKFAIFFVRALFWFSEYHSIIFLIKYL